MSKYEPLWNYLKEKNNEEYKLTFQEITKILGFSLNHSFLTYKKEAEDFGYIVEKISIKEKWIHFIKIKN